MAQINTSESEYVCGSVKLGCMQSLENQTKFLIVADINNNHEILPNYESEFQCINEMNLMPS